MSKVSIYPGVAGLTLEALLIQDSDNGNVWTGTGFEAISTLTDVEIAAAAIAMTPILSGDSTAVGYELEIPSAIDQAIVVHIFEGGYSVGDATYSVARWNPNETTEVSLTDLSLGFKALKVEIADFLGMGRNSEGDGSDWSTEEINQINSVVRSGLRRVYYPVRPDGSTHRWSFLWPTTTLTLSEPYETGTITVVDGVVTLASGTFPSWAASGELHAGNGIYQVASRDGDTQLTLDDTSVAIDAGSTYTLAQAVYDLPSDFADIEGDLTFAPTQAQTYKPVRIASDLAIRRTRQQKVYINVPTHAAIRPKSFDATVGQRWEIIFDPVPNAEKTVTYQYKTNFDIDGASNVYLPGGPDLAEVALVSCLAIAEVRHKEDGGRENTEQFPAILEAAIAADQARNCPDTLGYNSDPSDASSSSYSNPLIHAFDGEYYD